MKNTIWKFLSEYFDVFSIRLRMKQTNLSYNIQTMISIYEDSNIEDPEEIRKNYKYIHDNLHMRLTSEYTELLDCSHDDKATSYKHLNDILHDIRGSIHNEESERKKDIDKQIFLREFGDTNKFLETAQELETAEQESKTEVDDKIELLQNTSTPIDTSHI